MIHTGIKIHETGASMPDYKDYVQSVIWAEMCPAAPDLCAFSRQTKAKTVPPPDPPTPHPPTHTRACVVFRITAHILWFFYFLSHLSQYKQGCINNDMFPNTHLLLHTYIHNKTFTL
ncbi:hypothetical protein ATANTOWER_016190 [Ataeniobius toweri]|uniref:Uncharacterized protein n=1 Tax=Ataeniobius toweri TaxID=208326 RepID=A0ABU7AK58_9TELE|nr:hypothetical protein [Ataeniobius toweri]